MSPGRQPSNNQQSITEGDAQPAADAAPVVAAAVPMQQQQLHVQASSSEQQQSLVVTQVLQNEQLQQSLLTHMMHSEQLQQVIDARLEKLLQFKVQQAVAAHVAAANIPARSVLADVSKTDIPAQETSKIGAGSTDMHCTSSAAANKLQTVIDHLAVGQAEILQEALQHLQTRLASVEELVLHQLRQPQAAQGRPVEAPQHQAATPQAAGEHNAQHVAAEVVQSVESTFAAQVNPLFEEPLEERRAAPISRLLAACQDATRQSPDGLDARGVTLDSVHGCDHRGTKAAPAAVAEVPAVVEGVSPRAFAAPSQQTSTRSLGNAADGVAAAVAASRTASTDIIERQMAALQAEVHAQEIQAMQSAIDGLSRQVTALQQHVSVQAAMLGQQKESTAVSFAAFSPLEPQVASLTAQLETLRQDVITISSSQPSRFEIMRQEIQQLSMHLAEVNEASADASETEDIRAELAMLQQQLAEQAHQTTAAAAAVSEEFVSKIAAYQAIQAEASSKAAELAASLQEQLSSVQQQISHLQQNEVRIATAMGMAQEAEPEIADIKAQLVMLQQQLAEQARQAPAVATAATEALALRVAEHQAVQEEASGKAADLVANLQDELSSTQQQLSQLQQHVEVRIAAAVETAEGAGTSAALHSAAAVEQLSRQANELAGKLAALEHSIVEDKAAIAAMVESKFAELTSAEAEHEQNLKQQLKEQVTTMGELLAELGSCKTQQAVANAELQQRFEELRDEQREAESHQVEAQQALTAQLQNTAQQLREELQSSLSPIQEQLATAAGQLAEHGIAIESCAKAGALASVAATVRGLPGAVEAIHGRLDELAQAQRAAERQLNAAQEQQLVAHDQLGALQGYVKQLEASLNSQQRSVSGELGEVKQELQQLQQRKLTLQQLQEHQAAVILELSAAIEGVRSDLLETLASDREQLIKVGIGF